MNSEQSSLAMWTWIQKVPVENCGHTAAYPVVIRNLLNQLILSILTAPYYILLCL
jgi:hypothetical protein